MIQSYGALLQSKLIEVSGLRLDRTAGNLWPIAKLAWECGLNGSLPSSACDCINTYPAYNSAYIDHALANWILDTGDSVKIG